MKNIRNIGNVIKNQTGLTDIEVQEAHDKSNSSVNPIEFHNFNYPPCLRLYHYQTTNIKSPALGVIKKMRLAADLVFIV